MYMKNYFKYGQAVSDVVDTVLNGTGDTQFVKATKYISHKEIVRAVRKTFRGKILASSNAEITLTIGRPNYLEREFIKLCVKAGEPFPVKKIQCKAYNPKNNKLTRKQNGKV